MVFPMKRVEPFMEKAANQALAWREAAVEDVTMKEILHQSPHWDARQIKSHCDPGVSATQGEQRHQQRIRCVENRQRIEPPSRNTGLMAFVGCEQPLGPPIATVR